MVVVAFALVSFVGVAFAFVPFATVASVAPGRRPGTGVGHPGESSNMTRSRSPTPVRPGGTTTRTGTVARAVTRSAYPRRSAAPSSSTSSDTAVPSRTYVVALPVALPPPAPALPSRARTANVGYVAFASTTQTFVVAYQ